MSKPATAGRGDVDGWHLSMSETGYARGADETLSERVRRKYDSLTASQRRIARFCVTEPDRAASLTAFRIANELNVSESTVVRFATKVGYQGFPDMQSALRSAARQQARTAKPPSTGPIESRVRDSLQNDLQALEQSIARLDLNMLSAAADALDSGTHLFVCGLRTSFSLALLADFHIRHIHSSVRLLGDIGGTLQDDIELIHKGDTLLAFTFPVYDSRSIAAIEHAADVGAACVVVTDSALAPIPISDNVYPLTIRHDSGSFFNSNVAATALLNALVLRMVELRGKREAGFEHRVSEKFHFTRRQG